MKKICIPLAEGFEETEAVTLIDVLRRADFQVKTASLGSNLVQGAHDITVEADCLLKDISAKEFDMIILPGGMPGTKYLLESPIIKKLLEDFSKKDKYIGAICAAPMVLASAGLLENKAATSFPGTENKLGGAKVKTDRVVLDGNIITSKGPGTAMEFALAIVEKLAGIEKRDSLAEALIYQK